MEPTPRISITRRIALRSLAALGIGSVAFQRAVVAQLSSDAKLTVEMIRQAEWIAQIELDDQQRSAITAALERNLQHARTLRAQEIDADTVPALVFRPDFFYAVAQGSAKPQSSHTSQNRGVQVAWSSSKAVPKVADADLPFASLATQAALLANHQISSRELTELYLGRIDTFDPLLKCVVSKLEEHALQAASASDQRRASRKSLGILDGIPWVAKDLIAIPPWKTTWGAEPFKDQVRNNLATVAQRLQTAGAVLLAKVTLGALAWGDKWYGGMTRNPWNPQQGSSGSSAGSAAAVAAGLATFAVGSETLGSIVSPTTRCRTSGLRPTFGRISRAGCMPLAWSMDKLGPIARTADDLAYVFACLLGSDGQDPSVVERSFQWPLNTSLNEVTIGIHPGQLSPMEAQVAEFLESAGARLIPIDLRSSLPVEAMNFILGVEASTVFDDTYRHEPNADYGNWPNTFRQSQFIPAIQYLRANRLRSQLIVETEKRLLAVDVVLGGDDLLLTNLTGHPSVVIACGTDSSVTGSPVPGIVKMTSAAYREDVLLHVATAIQTAFPASPTRPPMETWL